MINISHVFFEIAHNVILQLNIDVGRQPKRQPPLLKNSLCSLLNVAQPNVNEPNLTLPYQTTPNQANLKENELNHTKNKIFDENKTWTSNQSVRPISETVNIT